MKQNQGRSMSLRGMGVAVVMLLLLACQGAQSGTVRLCLPATFNATVATACSRLLNQRTSGTSTTFQCISGGTAASCIQRVAGGTAEMTKLGGSDMFNANQGEGLLAYVAEVVSDSPGPEGLATYYSVAVTTKASCDELGAQASLAAFKGRNACMTGYQRTAGWMLPMGYMISQDIIPVVDSLPNVQQDAESVSAFFGNICAAGTAADGPTLGGRSWQPLCAACSGDCGSSLEGEPYVDYEGSLRCLMEGAGDIGFMKHTTPLEYAKDGSPPVGVDAKAWATLNKADLRLVCPTGGCAAVDDWATCYIARAATHAFMAKDGFAATADGAAAIAALSAAPAAFVRSAKALDPANPTLLLTASAQSLAKVETPSNFTSHFGPNALAAFKSMTSLKAAAAPAPRTPATPRPTTPPAVGSAGAVRICTISSAEQQFCQQAVQLMNSKRTGVTFSCVQKGNDIDCLAAIQAGEADMKSFDGPDIYNGLKDYNLKAIVAEDYGTGGVLGTDYYAVAVVRKEWCDDTAGGKPTFRDLQGKRMCATGYRRSAGWVMPTGFLVQAGVMPIKRDQANIEDDAETVAAFFSGGVCAARTADNGPANSADRRGARWDPLCKQCKGDCSSNIEAEPYYDYAGALRCLMEGAAEVAFTKHTIALDYAKDGSTPQPWSSLAQAELALLCPRGGCVPVSQAAQCHTATSAAHAVMVRADYPSTEQLKEALVTLSKDNDFRRLVFNKDSNAENYLFKSVSYQLVAVNDDTRAYLGSALGAFQGFDAFTEGRSSGLAAVPTSGSSTGGSSLSGGAIAGIVVGCSVGSALLAGLAMWAINKRGRKRMDDLTVTLSTAPSDKVDMKAAGY